MFVCVCKQITDSQIKQAVAEGAGNFRAVRKSLGVATQCGSCAALANQIIQQALTEPSPDMYYQVA